MKATRIISVVVAILGILLCQPFPAIAAPVLDAYPQPDTESASPGLWTSLTPVQQAITFITICGDLTLPIP